jgi:hypothetical protein
MAIRYNNNWETRLYGDRAKVLLIDVSSDHWPQRTQVTYSTFQHALSQICEHCQTHNPEVEIRHQNTMYEDDWKNYHALCPGCQEENDRAWQEQWDDLNADLRAGIADALYRRRIDGG